MKLLRPALVLTLFFVIVTGFAFPALIWGLSQALIPTQANGSMVKNAQGQIVGSSLIGQQFAKPEYFHPRPSAAGSGYDAANSSGTNLGPTSKKLIEGEEGFDGMKKLVADYRKENGIANDVVLPSDAVTRSASGLDPHISPRNADLQVARVAKARRMTEEAVRELVSAHTEKAFIGIFGDPTVNVLQLNLSLDQKKS